MYQCACGQVRQSSLKQATRISKNLKTHVELPKAGQSARIYIRIDDLETAESRFSLDIPVGMVKVGLAVARGFSRKLALLSWQDLQTQLAETRVGTLLDEQDDKNQERVLIYVENPQWS